MNKENMQTETSTRPVEDQANPPAQDNVEKLFAFIHDEGDDELIRAFILLLENAPLTP